MSFSDMFEYGYAKVKRLFPEEQRKSIEVIAEARGIPAKWIEDANAIFIPNDQFMLEIFGEEIHEYDCYSGGVCIWNNALLFPIRNVNGHAVGFGGFFPFEYLSDDKGANYYAYSSGHVMHKGSYMYFPQKNLMDAIRAGYLVVVDGMFDAISLSGAGYHAAALMGSSPTQQIMMQLRFVERVIIVADNDEAGYKLYDKLHRHLNQAVLFKQGRTKDADDILKSKYGESFKRALDRVIQDRAMYGVYVM